MFGLNLWARPFLHPATQGAQGLDVTSSYLPNPLASPALMVLASSAGETGARDGSQHPPVSAGLPASRSAIDKEAALHPFASFPMFRPGAPPLAGLHHPLWRPHLDPATLSLFRSGGPFHSLTSKDSDSPYPSAFMPAKRLRVDERGVSPCDGDASSHGDPTRGSPYHRRPSPVASREGSHSDGVSEHGDRYTPDSSVRDLSKWATADGQGLCCPICQAVLQAGEIQAHLSKELQQLHLLLSEMTNKEHGSNHNKRSYEDMVIDLSSSKEVTSKSRYDTFLRIKGNREARLAKVRGRRKRYNELAQQMSSPNTSSSLLDSSIEKDCGDEEQIDVISCDDPTRDVSTGELSSTATRGDNKRSVSSSISCSVCLEPYTSCHPVTSVQCWHVHCEKCWLKAMDGPKTCPQCNVTTSPSDLRRIFI